MTYRLLVLRLLVAIFRRQVERRTEPTEYEARLIVEAQDFLEDLDRAERKGS